MKNNIRLIVLLVGFFTCVIGAAPRAEAMLSPLSINIVPPLQFPPSDFSVTGVRASLLWGSHRNVYGFDLGVIGNVTTVAFVGIAVSGGFNMNYGSTTAIGTQAAGLFNYNDNKAYIYGAQLALGLNYNKAQSAVSGLQLAAIANLSKFTNIYGVQAAVFNQAQDVYGLQIGLVNMCSNLHGLQIGLLNFNEKGTFAVSPFLNVGF